MFWIAFILFVLACFLAGVVYEDEKTIKSFESLLNILELSSADQIKKIKRLEAVLVKTFMLEIDCELNKRIKDGCNVKEEKQKKEDWPFICPVEWKNCAGSDFNGEIIAGYYADADGGSEDH